MKNKGLETWLYSSIGVVAMLAGVVLVNGVGSSFKTRIDLTQERAYTLSEGTRAILSKIDTPVQIRFYCTKGENRMPVFLKNYAQRVEDLLGEFRQASKGQIEIQKMDPVPDSDAEDSARLDGMEGQGRMDGEALYLGLSVSMLDQKVAIPFLSPDRERMLEYDVARAISRVLTVEKPVVGIMSPLQYSGQGGAPMMMQRGGSQPWVLVSELKRDFKVKDIAMNEPEIPADVKVLVLIHPKGLSEAGQYAIDQFVLRGGKLLAFLDPMSVFDRGGQGANPMGLSMGGQSNMEKLLTSWGLKFDTSKVVADMNFVGRTREGRQPTVLVMNELAANRDDIASADVSNLVLAFAGAFSGTPVEGLKQTVLIHSSKNSQLVESMSAQFGGERVIQDFFPSNTEYPIAVRLGGKFKTAFPDGKPGAAPAPAEGEKKDAAPASAAGLKESTGEGVVVLIGDADFIQDPIAVQEVSNPFSQQRMMMPANGNLSFVQGLVEQLSGDKSLIGVRSRASRDRQFTVVREMQSRAESAYQAKIKSLEASLNETQNKLNELQRSKGDNQGQRFILSPEQQAEIANFRAKERDVKLQLKQERKRLRSDIDSLETNIKWLNIALMPAVVSVAGLGLALLRQKRRAAR